MTEHDSPPKRTVCLYVCTYRRNEQLTALIETVRTAVEHAADRVELGLVIVDDNVDGRASAVAERFTGDHAFPLGVHYRHTGSGNISIARNTGMEAASKIADWVAMTDDDCEVCPEWLSEFDAVLTRTDADALCGPHVRKAPAGAPRWLVEHPFLEAGDEGFPADGSEPSHGQTNNSVIRSSFLIEHPALRFDLELGKLGGEDVVFYHEARQVGLRLRFARNAVVSEEASGERLTLKYYLQAGFWFGNTQYVTSVRTTGLTRGRAVLRGSKRLASAVVRPIRQLVRREPLELTYAASLAATALGLMVGPFGVKLRHPA